MRELARRHRFRTGFPTSTQADVSATLSSSMSEGQSASAIPSHPLGSRRGQDTVASRRVDYSLPDQTSTSKPDNYLLPAGDNRRSRSASVDSADVSIADSMTRLLPASHSNSPKSQIPRHRDTGEASSGQVSNANLNLPTHNDLMPEEKAMIMKRMRKLEDRLGAKVRETEDGQLFIDQPASGSRHSKDMAGYRLEHSVRTNALTQSMGSEMLKSKLASKARAVLGKDKEDNISRRVLVSPIAGTFPRPIGQIPGTMVPSSPSSVALFEGRQGRIPGPSETGSMGSEEFTSEDDIQPNSHSLSRQSMAKVSSPFGGS